MKATELRIGNWVNFNGAHVQVDIISEYDKEATLLSKLKPILLTEEWLLRFGWVWNEECNSYEKPGEVRMNLAERDGIYTAFNHVLKATIAERIQYVHHLQNLYFTLTVEDLVWK